MTTTARAKWTRVNRHRRCPLCGPADWCLLAEDGTAVICPRTLSSRWVGKDGGGYLHKLNGSPLPAPPRRNRSRQSRGWSW